MKSLTVIISTSNERIKCLKLKPFREGIFYVVVHQVYDENYINQDYLPFLSRIDVNYIKLKYPGLSKSRNVGIASVKTKFGYIMDDDVDFDLDGMIRLCRWMDANQVDVATCQFAFENGLLRRDYKKASFKHSMFSAASVSSIEICVDVEKINERGIGFDQKFGLGTDLPSGEEYIFLTDCIKCGLNVWFYPVSIGFHPNITSGMDFYSNSNKILAKREMLKRIFGWKSFVFIFLFWLKKSPIVLRSGHFILFTKTILFRRR